MICNSSRNIISITTFVNSYIMNDQNTSELPDGIFRRAIDQATDCIIIINSRGIILNTNKKVSEFLGYVESEMVGQNVSMLMPRPDKEQHDSYIDNYHRTGKKKIIGIGREVNAQHKDGRQFPVRLAVSEMVVNGVKYFTGILHDLSSLRQAQKELEKVNRELEAHVNERTVDLKKTVNKLLETNNLLTHAIKQRKAAEQTLEENQKQISSALEKERELGKLKSIFMTTASHEFRTPLSTILSSASLIEKYPNLEQQDKRIKHTQKIKGAVKNLNTILNDFMSIRKFEEGKIKPEPSSFTLQSFLRNLTDNHSALLGKERKIILKGEKDIDLIQDESILKNIYGNLISNAIKYSSKDIEISYWEKDKLIYTEVKDRGIGIPEPDQQLLFQRFFRGSNIAGINGTGLGLNIVLFHLELIGGEISYESTENVGTTFKIIFPKKFVA